MYLRILKKDLKRKKTMNLILLVFITLAAMFIASSTNNMITVSTALDTYFEKADVPDYWFATAYEQEIRRFDSFARDNGYRYNTTSLIQVDPKQVTVSGEPFDYNNSLVLSSIGGPRVFDSNADEITRINDGEIYVPAIIFGSDKNDFYEGCRIVIAYNGTKSEFTLKGYTKDALFGSSMIGMSRFLISENDLALFNSEYAETMYSVAVYTDDSSFTEKFNDLNPVTVMHASYSIIKRMYIMDMLIAAILLVVSICLILISMVILRFTIHFTMSEEFREIGVMKAIGITHQKIRWLYITKYFAISVLGSTAGLFLSIPFSRLLINSVSQNIIISENSRLLLNIICAIATTAVVVLFCYFCTGKIKAFSPIDAIRNGETGERYSRKGFFSLYKSRLAPIPFMAVNDIFSSLKRYVSMIIIFTLGLLLIIIPNNVINTLCSDNLIAWFNMTGSDLVISKETLFSPGKNNMEMVDTGLDEVKKELLENDMEADVFQEILFRFHISHGNKNASSLAFQGRGDVTADMYSYLEGSAPKNNSEVAISYLIADAIDTEIGDDVRITMGEETKTYTVTAINQSMNNLGEGIRFYQDEKLDYSYAAGSFGIQILFTDSPDKKTLNERKKLLQNIYPDTDIYTCGEYINYMIGDAGGQIEGVKKLIIGIILCINTLVAVLMVKSFLTKEKGEIALLKAMGFKNPSIIIWQSLRIGIVMLLAIILGIFLSSPLSKLLIEPIFRMMGAYSIKFTVVPLEVYVIYPLILLATTTLAALAAACGARKIPARETANIE